MSTLFPNKLLRCPAFLTASLLIVLCSVNSLHGQGLDQVSQHFNTETSVLVRIDPAVFDALIGEDRQDEEDLEQTVLQARLKKAQEILGDEAIWLVIGFPQTPLSVQIIVSDPDGKRIENLKELWDFTKRPPFGPVPSVVFRNLADADSSNSIEASRLEDWEKLWANKTEAPQGTIQFACLPPAHLYETYLELLPQLPGDLGGGPVTLLTDGLKSASGSFDLKTGMLKSSIKSASPDAAAAFGKRVTLLFNQFVGQLALKSIGDLQEFLTGGTVRNEASNRIKPLIQHLARSVFRSVEGELRWEIPVSESWQPNKMLKLAFGSSANRSALKRLRNLAIGVLNYESANRHLPPPPASRGPNGPSGLSWRVHILPYLGEAALFKEFALDEPWDSPTNIKLLDEMPDVYSDYGSKLFAPADAKPGYTTVVAPVSENTILGAPRKITFSAIVDGTSNTILIVNVKDSLAVPWTAPQDYVFDPDQPSAGLKFIDGKTATVFCDGSTHQLIEEIEWVKLFEMNDGAVVELK